MEGRTTTGASFPESMASGGGAWDFATCDGGRGGIDGAGRRALSMTTLGNDGKPIRILRRRWWADR